MMILVRRVLKYKKSKKHKALKYRKKTIGLILPKDKTTGYKIIIIPKYYYTYPNILT